LGHYGVQQPKLAGNIYHHGERELRCANPYTHSYWYANPNANTYTYTYTYTDTDSDANPYTNSNSNSYCYTDTDSDSATTDIYTNAHSDSASTDTYGDTDTNSYNDTNSYGDTYTYPSIRGGRLQSRGWGTGFELGQAGAGIGTDVGDREQPGDPRHRTSALLRILDREHV